jgi:Raf kinase inhibitor-like YbhB/YbcL family protein
VILVLLAAGVGAILLRSSIRHAKAVRLTQVVQKAETEYHAALAKTLAVSSESFKADGDIPPEFTCSGASKSPDVSWKNSPGNAMSYVLIMVDWDAPWPSVPASSLTHWILYNIPRQGTQIAAGINDADLRQKAIDVGENAFGKRVYAAPCPESRHRYIVRVYALDVPQIHPASTDRQGVIDAMRGHVLAYGELAGLFGS